MKLKRGIALLLAAVFLFGTLAVPASAAAAQPEPAAQAQTVDAEENDIISVRIKASGELTYGADHKLEIQTTPADAQYIGVVMGTSGQATGYVTLVLSEKIRILLKLIPLPKKMSATPDQTEEFNVYSYLKQLIDGNDVSVLLRVGDEAVSVLNIINFYLPSAYVKTIQNVSNGLKLALDLIRKYLPESAFTRIYLDEQPVDAGGYVAGAVALESGDINSAGVAMFKIKPQTSNVRLYWAGDLPGSLTAEELRNELLPRGTLENGDFKRQFSKRGCENDYHIEPKRSGGYLFDGRTGACAGCIGSGRNSVYIYNGRHTGKGHTDRSTTGRLDRRTDKVHDRVPDFCEENRL